MLHRAFAAHAPPRKPHRAANHQQAEGVQRNFVNDKIYALVKKRLRRLAPHQRRAVMLDADKDGPNEQREESPEQHAMREARLGSRAAQGALDKGTRA